MCILPDKVDWPVHQRARGHHSIRSIEVDSQACSDDDPNDEDMQVGINARHHVQEARRIVLEHAGTRHDMGSACATSITRLL